MIMCGDAPGDLAAAEKNGVFFFPILVKKEKESWQEFMDVALNKLISGKYNDGYAEDKMCQFKANLSK